MVYVMLDPTVNLSHTFGFILRLVAIAMKNCCLREYMQLMRELSVWHSSNLNVHFRTAQLDPLWSRCSPVPVHTASRALNMEHLLHITH